MTSDKGAVSFLQNARRAAQPLVVAMLFACSTLGVQAQSLKADAPTPMKAGINRGLVDALVGSQYWTYTAQPGTNKVHVSFTAMGVLGTAPRTSVTFTISDMANTWHTSKVLTSQGEPVDTTFTGELKTPTKVVLSVNPPTNALVRVGGNYEIEASGAVAFGPASNVAPIVGVYKQMSGYTKLLGDCKFTVDGKIVTTSGATGNWKIFDEGTQVYVINIEGEERHSLKFIQGRGLVDGDIIVYQQLK